MGDFHFIVRHALTGIVLLGFLFIGLYIFHEPLAFACYQIFLGNFKDFSSALPLLISAPVVGIVVQAVYIAYLHLKKSAFTDEARSRIADMIMEKLSANRKEIGESLADGYIEAFRKMPSDAPFVWLYHGDVDSHLIDWARRRRSYHYLGCNWAIAAALGLFIGYAVTFFIDDSVVGGSTFTTINRNILLVFLWAFNAAWLAGALWLAHIMKKDVDSMELAWSLGFISPKFKKLVSGEEDSEKKEDGRSDGMKHGLTKYFLLIAALEVCRRISNSRKVCSR